MGIFNTFRIGRKRDRDISSKESIIAEFNRSLSLFIDQDQLQTSIISKLKEVLSVNDIYIYFINSEQTQFVTDSPKLASEELYLEPNDKLIFWLNVNQKCLSVSRQPEVVRFLSGKEQDFIERYHIEIIYPLRVLNQTRGFVMIPLNKSGIPYDKYEIELLSSLLDQASFALESTSLYQQQKERLKKMYRADKLAMTGQLAAGAAHEIRNPLTSIRSTIQYLKRDIVDDSKRALADEVIVEVDRINDIIQGLLSFAKPTDLQLEMIDLNSLLEQSLNFTSNTARDKEVKIDCKLRAGRPMIYADPEQLKQVFLNIILNAIEAIEGGGSIDIEVVNNGVSSSNSNSEIAISFKDSGIGISEESQERIFEPFFTTKQEGTGLGLSISYGIINRHGGDILIRSASGKGTTITVILPLKR